VAARCGELLDAVAAENGWQIVTKEVMPHHVHKFVRMRRSDTPAEVATVRRYIEHQRDAVA
jgi:REP element-mobilizing transposase RayT